MAAVKHPDWDAIKTEYIAGNVSTRDLADRYGLNRSLVSKRCSQEHWVEQRKKHHAKIVRKAADRAAAKDAKKLANLIDATEMLAARCKEIIGNQNQFDYRVVDARGIRDMALALKELTGMMRQFYDLPTPQEATAQRIALERLEIERSRARLGESGQEDSGGIVMIPEVMQDDG